jgi:hypothetical protein
MAATSTVPEEFVRLVAAFAAVTDPRFARGKVHPLPGVLALVVLGLMAGCRSLSAISRYGQIHPEVLAPLGLRRSPSVATLHRLLRCVSVAEVRAVLRDFTRQLQQQRTAGTAVGTVAVDGKTLRGVWEKGEQLHLLHLFAHGSALALDQLPVPSVPDETQAAQDWLATVAATFPGLSILSGDALYAERDLCAAVVDGQRDYVLRLKKTKAPSMRTRSSSSALSPAPRMPSA